MGARGREPVPLLASAIAASGLSYRRVALAIAAWSRAERTRPDPATTSLLEPTASQVGDWRNGVHEPTGPYVPALAAVLRIDLDELRRALAAYWSETRNRRRSVAGGQGAMLSADLRSLRDNVQRRRFPHRGGDAHEVRGGDARGGGITGGGMTGGGMTGGGMTGGGMTGGGMTATPLDTRPIRLSRAAGGGIGRGTLDGFESAVEHYARNLVEYRLPDLEQRLGAQLGEVAALLEAPRAALKEKTRLCWIGARLSAMHGRVSGRLGKLDDARLHLNAAFDLAEQVDDHELMAWTLAEESVVALHDGHVSLAYDLAHRGRQIATGDNLLALASLEAPRAARLGNRYAATAAIQVAMAALDNRGASAHPGETWDTLPAGVLHRVAAAHLWLGDAEKAIATAEAALAACELPADHAINAMHANLVIASSHAKLGDPAAACARAIDVLQRSGSNYYLVVRSRELATSLRPYAAEQAVQELDELVRGDARSRSEPAA